MPLRIILLTPDQSEPGGIQQYSRVLEQGLCRNRGVEVGGSVEYKGSITRFLTDVLRCLIAGRVDTIWMTHPHFLRLMPLFQLLKIPVLVSCHGVEVWDIRKRWLRRGLRQAHCLLPVSRFTRDKILDQLGTCRFHIFPNHLESVSSQDESRDEARRTLGWDQEECVLLMVGRMAKSESYKGHDQVLRIFPELKRRIPELKLVIVGDGDGREQLIREATELGIANQVRFMGRVDAAMLQRIYLASDGFTMPSVGEGFGIVFLEALSYGLPVLAGNRDGSADALADGALGWLVDPMCPVQLLDGLVALLEKRATADAGQRKARVYELFGPAAMDRRIDELVKLLCVDLQAG